VYVTDKTKLMQKSERLRSSISCKKFKLIGVETLFLPCRHLVTYEESASSMENYMRAFVANITVLRSFSAKGRIEWSTRHQWKCGDHTLSKNVALTSKNWANFIYYCEQIDNEAKELSLKT